jgi:hypothetical protein
MHNPLSGVPEPLIEWVKERQAILDQLLVEEPHLYIATRLQFQKEYAKLYQEYEMGRPLK